MKKIFLSIGIIIILTGSLFISGCLSDNNKTTRTKSSSSSNTAFTSPTTMVPTHSSSFMEKTTETTMTTTKQLPSIVAGNTYTLEDYDYSEVVSWKTDSIMPYPVQTGSTVMTVMVTVVHEGWIFKVYKHVRNDESYYSIESISIMDSVTNYEKTIVDAKHNTCIVLFNGKTKAITPSLPSKWPMIISIPTNSNVIVKNNTTTVIFTGTVTKIFNNKEITYVDTTTYMIYQNIIHIDENNPIYDDIIDVTVYGIATNE